MARGRRSSASGSFNGGAFAAPANGLRGWQVIAALGVGIVAVAAGAILAWDVGPAGRALAGRECREFDRAKQTWEPVSPDSAPCLALPCRQKRRRVRRMVWPDYISVSRTECSQRG